MSRLILVRHAQASFGGADYDQLSPLGEAQARELGAYWAARSTVFHQVFVGPRQRHQRTAEIVGATFVQRGLPWPEAIMLPELDEYAGLEVFRAGVRRFGRAETESATSATPAAGAAGVDRPVTQSSTELLKLFQDIISRWVRGEWTVPGVETWPEFRQRARRGLETMLAGEAHGRQIAAFTSTGPVAAALDLALGLDDERMLEASWQLRNTAVSEFLFTGPRFSLGTFNALPHLAAIEMITPI